MLGINKGGIALLLIIFLPILSRADMCFRSFEEDTTVAKAIFVGKVVKIERGQYWHQGFPKVIFTFEVIESFKGLRQRTGYISLIGPIDGCCNVHFEKDSTFLVFAYGDCENSRILWTNDCSTTGLLSIEKANYHKLGNSIKHSANSEDLEYMNVYDTKTDSLLRGIGKLNGRIESIQEEKRSLKKYLIALGVFACLLGVLGIIKTKKNNPKVD